MADEEIMTPSVSAEVAASMARAFSEAEDIAKLEQYERQANRFSNIAIISGTLAAGCGTALVLKW